MLTALAVFACQFAYVALLGLQQLNVVGKHYTAAFAVSLCLGVLGYHLVAVIAIHAHQAAGAPAWWGYVFGGPAGIVFSMWLHPRLRRWGRNGRD